jgi:pimeloyl-ACP methyl ester carboxylesterase
VSSNRNVVLVHGAWADGSSWSRVIPLLQDEGYRVTAVQIPLTSLAEDVAMTRRVLAAQQGPTVLAGHSYGGAVITAAGTDAPHVAGLVYVAAFAPDEGESLNDLNTKPGPGQTNIRPDAQGFLWLDQDGFPDAFAGGVDRVQARVMAAVQKPIAARVFGDKISRPAWKSKPSWYLISENDRMILPVTQRSMAERMGANLVTVPASHASLVSHPGEVARVIMDAAVIRAGARGVV